MLLVALLEEGDVSCLRMGTKAVLFKQQLPECRQNINVTNEVLPGTVIIQELVIFIRHTLVYAQCSKFRAWSKCHK